MTSSLVVMFSIPLMLALVALAPPPIARASETNLLMNGGFEEGTEGWGVHPYNYKDCFSLTPEPNHIYSGSFAAALTSTDLNPKWIYQVVEVVPEGTYTFSGWAIKDNPGMEKVYLRVSWYDDSGNWLCDTGYSELTSNNSNYQFLTTGPITAPEDAHSAKAKCGLTPASVPVTAYFDDLSFLGPSALDEDEEGETADSESVEPNNSGNDTASAPEDGQVTEGNNEQAKEPSNSGNEVGSTLEEGQVTEGNNEQVKESGDKLTPGPAGEDKEHQAADENTEPDDPKESTSASEGGILSGTNLRALLISAGVSCVIIGFWLKKVLSGRTGK